MVQLEEGKQRKNTQFWEPPYFASFFFLFFWGGEVGWVPLN